jgi:photosystem II stability/assembly factor-like uncharacterized protein
MGFPRLVAAGLLLTGGLRAERPPESFSLFLDLARAGEAVVAVGEHGLVLRSEDEGKTWVRTSVPATSTLTSVAFIDEAKGWACGQEGTLLSTGDGGRTWIRREGTLAADASPLVVRAAGPRLILAGAFGLLSRSFDAGATWTQWEPPEGGPHVYSVFDYQDGWLLAGEMGFLGALPDSGPLKSLTFGAPSLHGLLPLKDGTLLAFGIRGNLYRREAGREDWRQVPTASTQLIACGVGLRNGHVILAGQSGLWLLSRDRGRTFANARRPEGMAGVAALIETRDGWVLCAGEKGIVRISVPQEESP